MIVWYLSTTVSVHLIGAPHGQVRPVHVRHNACTFVVSCGILFTTVSVHLWRLTTSHIATAKTVWLPWVRHTAIINSSHVSSSLLLCCFGAMRSSASFFFVLALDVVAAGSCIWPVVRTQVSTPRIRMDPSVR